jgi:hypothetical protein
MAEITRSEGSVPAMPSDDYFTVEAREPCARVKHKSEVTDGERLMLALAAAQAALARYFHPGARPAEEALNAIGAILDHEDVVANGYSLLLERNLSRSIARIRTSSMSGT